MWFPRLASDRVLKARPIEAPFALTFSQQNTDRFYCLNPQAEALGLNRGMSFADARAFCPSLISQPARPDLDARFLTALRRWATRYCPWVGLEGEVAWYWISPALPIWPAARQRFWMICAQGQIGRGWP